MRVSLAFICFLSAAPMAHAEVKTVSWFLTHADARGRVHQLCMNNPGEAQRIPDCLNAATAVEQSAMMGVMGRIPVKSMAQVCSEYPEQYRRVVMHCP
jgi:hypothetical protein